MSEIEGPAMVFCSDCRFHDSWMQFGRCGMPEGENHVCNHPDNISVGKADPITGSRRITRISHPEYINHDCSCSLFEKRETKKLFKVFGKLFKQFKGAI